MPITKISCWILVFGQVFFELYEQQQSEDKGDKEGVNMAPKKRMTKCDIKHNSNILWEHVEQFWMNLMNILY